MTALETIVLVIGVAILIAFFIGIIQMRNIIKENDRTFDAIEREREAERNRK